MKIDFANLNLAPMPNPKPLRVERVTVAVGAEGKQGQPEVGYIRNANLHPEAVIGN